MKKLTIAEKAALKNHPKLSFAKLQPQNSDSKSQPANAAAAPGPEKKGVKRPFEAGDGKEKVNSVHRHWNFRFRLPSFVQEESEPKRAKTEAAQKPAAHKGVFQSGWQKHRPWLQHADKIGMTCLACIHSANKCNFTKGTTSIRTDTITAHETTAGHKFAVVKWEAAKTAETAKEKAKSDLKSFIASMNAQAVSAITKRLKIVYYLMLKDRPLSDYGSQLELATDLGVPDFDVPLILGNGVQYLSHKFAEEASEAIGEYLWQQALTELKASPALSIMLDESTDAANLKQLIIYLGGVKDGKSFTRFATLQPIDDGKADTITSALLTFLDACGLDLSKFYGLCSDGASVMLGANEGALLFFCSFVFDIRVAQV
jgi:hypothetical protein